MTAGQGAARRSGRHVMRALVQRECPNLEERSQVQYKEEEACDVAELELGVRLALELSTLSRSHAALV